MSVNTDFILLIMNCKKYRHKAIKQKQTWLKNFDIMPYYHVIGEPELPTSYKFDNDEQILYVKTADDYNSLPKKVIAAYEAINKEFNFKYIFKTDDDQILCDNKFLKTIQLLLLNKQPTIHYGGYIVNVERPYVSKYCTIHPELPENLIVYKTKYCSGRFYLLSQLAVQYLITQKSKIGVEYLEDYAIGFYLDNSLKSTIFNIQTNKYFTDII